MPKSKRAIDLLIDVDYYYDGIGDDDNEILLKYVMIRKDWDMITKVLMII